MKIQGLAVLAIIIILPMSIILSAYMSNQIKTLDLQISYDSKLTNATYDAIKVFQLNMSNSSTSDLANSKMRDIKASVNTFYNSLSTNFNMSGYGKDVLQEYVPAIVYTLYDGYYIYSAYDNTLDTNDTFENGATYKNNEKIYGLKPYVYYSCRYIKDNIDVVITYSLDSYVTIQGKIGSNEVNESGYLLTGVGYNGSNYTYNGIEITNEQAISQNVYLEGTTSTEAKKNVTVDVDGVPTNVGVIDSYPCKKINGVKYYNETDSSGNTKTFAILNDKKYEQSATINMDNNSSAVTYYKNAYYFKQKFFDSTDPLSKLIDLKSNDAVNIDGTPFSNLADVYHQGYSIFDELKGANGVLIEDSNSQFNAHKAEVIKNSIETNLMSAIANYNNVSSSSVNFAMPKLTEEEWDKIVNNVSVITFLQGLNIGGKIYNGYAIVPNNSNEDFVSEDSIYISVGGEYHKVTHLTDSGIRGKDAVGIFRTDLERRTAETSYKKDLGDGNSKEYTGKVYYYPRTEMGCYNCIINYNNATSSTSIREHLNENQDLAKIYYTALGRERQGMYRVMNIYEEIQEEFNN